jgi:hypothetical protein
MLIALSLAAAQPVHVRACLDAPMSLSEVSVAANVITVGRCDTPTDLANLEAVTPGPASHEDWLRTHAGLSETTWADRPVPHLPVVQITDGIDATDGWALIDASGTHVLPYSEVRSAPRWVQTVPGEDGAWLGWARTADGVLLVLLADGEVHHTVVDVSRTLTALVDPRPSR